MSKNLKTLDYFPFYATGLFLYSVKTSESQSFLMFSEGVKKNGGMKRINELLPLLYNVIKIGRGVIIWKFSSLYK